MSALATQTRSTFHDLDGFSAWVSLLDGHDRSVKACQQVGWDDLAKLLGTPHVGAKAGPSWMPARHPIGPRKGAAVEEIGCLVLDVDNKHGSAPKPADLADELRQRGMAALIHTSHSHAPEVPRYRVIFPLTAPLQGDRVRDIRQIGLAVCAMLGLSDEVDAACLEAARLFYLPRCAGEAMENFEFHQIDGSLLDSTVAHEPPRAAVKPKQQGGGGSVIDAFNAANDPGAILERNGYQPRGARWVYPGSQSHMPGVYRTHDDAQRVVSQHGDDPLGRERNGNGQPLSHDAFGVFAVLEHGGDQRAAIKAAARELGMDRKGSSIADISAYLDRVAAENSQQEQEPIEQQAPPLRMVTLDDLATAEPKPVQFWVRGIVPARAVTMLGAHGGSGKSTLAAGLGAHLAAGATWNGLECKQARVVFVSLEDDADLVRYRLRLACEAYELPMARIAQNMVVMDGTESGALVEEYSDHGNKVLLPNGSMKQLESMEADVWIIDNASDAFDANENERRMVRAFIRRLASLARKNGGAVLLLAHLPKESAKNGGKESYSGSTAWHNSARSRLALVSDGDQVKLEHQKSNFGKCIDPLHFKWTDRGVLIPAQGPINAPPAGEVVNLDGVVLAGIEKAAADGVHIPTAMAGARTAASVLREMLAAPGVTKQGINSALIRLEQRGYIQRTEITTKARHVREVWEPAPNAPNAPNDDFSATSGFGAEAAPNAPKGRARGMGGYMRADFSAGDQP